MRECPIVRLSVDEVQTAACVGVYRHCNAAREGRDLGHRGKPTDRSVWNVDIEAACSEAAVAKAIGYYWPADFKSNREFDIPPNIEVKMSEDVENNLIVNVGEFRPDKLYVLVLGRAPRFIIPGAVHGEDLRKLAVITDPGNRGKLYKVYRHKLPALETFHEVMDIKDVTWGMSL